jgi:putative redox protein
MTTVHCTTTAPGTYRHRMNVAGHELAADLPKEEGGEDTAPGAHDYFDASLAACKALTAMWYAKKNGFALEGVDVDVDRDDSEERHGKYRLVVRIAYHGALTDAEKTRIHAAVAKCPVSKLMTTAEVVVETAPL